MLEGSWDLHGNKLGLVIVLLTSGVAGHDPEP